MSSDSKLLSVGVRNIYECIEELNQHIDNKHAHYLTSISDRWMKCGDAYLDSVDKMLDNLMKMDINENNIEEVGRSIVKIGKLLSKSYAGFLDSYYLANLYNQPPDKLYEMVKHLYSK